MKKIVMVFMMSLLFITGCSSKNKDEKVIGVIQWTEHPALDDAREGLIEGLKDTNIKVVVKNANEDASNANMIVQQFVNDDVDLIYAIATPAAQAAMNGAKNTKIPVIFNAVTDAVSAGLVDSNEKPGRNVTGVSDSVPVDAQLKLIKEFIPNAKKVGVLYNTRETNSLHQIESIEAVIKNHGMELETQGITGSEEIAFATEAILKKTDAIYIITDNMIAKATSQVVGIANKGGKPVFMAEAGQFDQGILASDSISYVGLGKQAAEMSKAIILEGKSASEIPVETATSTELFVSEKVADLLGINIPNSILERAVIK